MGWGVGGKSAEIKEKEKKENQHKRAASIGRRKSHLLLRTPWPWDVRTNEREELMQAQFGTANTHLSFPGYQAHYEVRGMRSLTVAHSFSSPLTSSGHFTALPRMPIQNNTLYLPR